MKWSIPESVIKKGRAYVEEDRVLSVVADETEKKWHAQVMGHELYLVDLDGTTKEKDYCQCLFWQEKGFCKHTVAVELYLKKQGLSRIIDQDTFHEKQMNTVAFHEVFTQGIIESQGKQEKIQTDNLVLHYQLEAISTNPYRKDHDLLALSIKIGYRNERQYVIKNIGEFLKLFEKEACLLMNQQYPFYLYHKNFLKEDKTILTCLLNMYDSQQMLFNGGYTLQTKADKKYLFLPKNGFISFLRLLFDTSRVTFSLNKEYKTLHFEKKLPLIGEVTKEKEGFRVKWQHQVDHYFSFYHLAFDKGTFYTLTAQNERLYQTFLQLMKRQNQMDIFYPFSELSLLFSQVIPLMESIATIKKSKEVQRLVLEYPLQPAFYLRKKQGHIHLRVDFNYDTSIFSTDKTYTSENSPFIVRQLKEEQHILEVVQSLKYQKRTPDYEKALPNGYELYRFFTEEIPKLQTLGTVHLGKKLRSLFIHSKEKKPAIYIDSEESWLSVHFDISGVEEKEIRKVIQAINEQQSFYETKEGKIIDLNDETYKHTAQILQILRGKWQRNGRLKVANYQSIQLNELLETHYSGQKDTSFQQMVKDLTIPSHFNVTLPKTLQATLREYQVKGFQWLKMLSHYQLSGILADEMGLGKTLQLLTFLLAQKEEKKYDAPTLIVAPASLTYNWLNECQRFTPTLNVSLIVGTKEVRQQLLKDRTKDIYITSYSSLRQDEALYQNLTFSCLVLDEAQMVKNAATKTAQALRTLNIPQRFALSGTPIENNLLELWSLFAILLPGFFPKKKAFQQMDVKTISHMIQPFVLRREKQKVLQELPEKIETNLYNSLYDEQKTVYLAYLRQMQDSILEMDHLTFSKNRLSILAGLTRLRQICCDPRMFISDFNGKSGKLEQLKTFLIDAKKNHHRILLFSQFTKMLDIIQKELEELELDSFYLQGSTPPKKRLEMVNAFNEGQKDIFLISLKAGGTGLNLTGADTVILYDLWWNPAVEQQAASRAHRMGQKKIVNVYKMITKGTIEERMYALQKEKRELFDEVLNGHHKNIEQLTEEDIRNILFLGEETT